MVKIFKKRDIQQKWNDTTCPKIMKKLNEMIVAASHCNTVEGGGDRFEVSTVTDIYDVNIVARTCSCRKWQLT